MNAGGPYSGDEGAPIGISGSATDPENHTITYAWTYSPASGVDPGATCAFGDASAAATTVTCTDDGTFTLTLSGDRCLGHHQPRENATLTVANVAPTIIVDSPAAGSLYQVNAPVSVSPHPQRSWRQRHAHLPDRLGQRYHHRRYDYRGNLRRQYSYPAAGIYTIVVTVADDDGGSNSASTSVVVFDPNGGFVTGGGWIDSPAGAIGPIQP